MSDVANKAIDYFNNGYNCAQSVSCVFSEKYNLPITDCFRANSGFGGGLKAGETCGAAVGGVLALGLAFGPGLPDEENKIDLVNSKTKEFMTQFSKIKGCTRCSDILGSTPAQRAELSDEETARDRLFCSEIIEKTIEILEDLGC